MGKSKQIVLTVGAKFKPFAYEKATSAQVLARDVTQYFAGHLQEAYLVLIALVMMVDSVGTITFRYFSIRKKPPFKDPKAEMKSLESHP